VAGEECEGRRDFFGFYAVSPSANFLWNTTVINQGVSVIIDFPNKTAPWSCLVGFF
jgi:hypothetical protein